MKSFPRFACIAGLLFCNAYSAPAQSFDLEPLPEIAALPAGLPWNQENVLKSKLAAVALQQKEYARLKAVYSQTPHKGIVPGSDQEKKILEMISQINNAKAIYRQGIKDFNADVAAVTAAGSSPSGNRPPQDSIPAVHTEELYTAEELRDAKEALKRLRKFKRGLEAKLAELGKWRADLDNESKEFEALRSEVIRRDLSDILAEVPAAGIVNEFSQSAKYSQYITPRFAHDFEVAYGTLSALASETDALTATEDSKKLEKNLDAVLGMQKVMLSFPMSKLPEGSKAKQYLTAMSTVFDAAGKVIVFTQEKSSENWQQRYASLTLELGSTLPGQLGILSSAGVAVKNEIGRSRKARIANEALESLGGALGQNWNAKLKLTERLERVNSDIMEEDREVQGYILAHPGTKK